MHKSCSYLAQSNQAVQQTLRKALQTKSCYTSGKVMTSLKILLKQLESVFLLKKKHQSENKKTSVNKPTSDDVMV